jgi:murein L,D-transpeptidase YcbB/YkuD
VLEALPPPHAGYARLHDALKDLRELGAAGGWPSIPEGPTLEAGSLGPRVDLLRQRLFEPDREGGSAAGAAWGAGDPFDEALAESVRHFQQLHGIDPDGKVGPTTLGELNVPVERRIGQVELNLERWRWIPRTLGDPHVFVNIPGFDLELVRRVPTWRTRIVVGKAFCPPGVQHRSWRSWSTRRTSEGIALDGSSRGRTRRAPRPPPAGGSEEEAREVDRRPGTGTP